MTHRREENNFFVLGNQNDTLDTKELYMLFDPTPSTCPLVSCCIKTTIPHSWYIFPINSLTTFLYFFSSNSFSLKICSILIYSTLWGADPIEHWYYSVSNPFFFIAKDCLLFHLVLVTTDDTDLIDRWGGFFSSFIALLKENFAVTTKWPFCPLSPH